LVRQVGIINEPSYVAEPVVHSELNLKPGVLDGIRAAMCGVTTDISYGTAYFVFKDWGGGAVICGKTGTAETGGLPHGWFVAFAGKSADEPEIAVVAMVERSNEGSYVASPIARRIIEEYYDLPITAWPPWYEGGMPVFETGGQ
jgi:penicillin-binding protein 2